MERKTVTIRSTVIGGGLPKICVPLVAENEEELKRALEALDGTVWDLAEWRVDYFEAFGDETKLEYALGLIRKTLGERPLLFTFRSAREGGEREISWEQYARLNIWAAGSGLIDLADVEMSWGRERVSELIGKLQNLGACVLVSSHDFEKTPDTMRMVEILREMQNLGADISKLAVMPECREDVLRLLEASVMMRERWADRPFVTMSMGAMGAISRVGAGFDGSAITFGTAGRSSAPGQVPADELAACLRILSEGVE